MKHPPYIIGLQPFAANPAKGAASGELAAGVDLVKGAVGACEALDEIGGVSPPRARRRAYAPLDLDEALVLCRVFREQGNHEAASRLREWIRCIEILWAHSAR